jgi:hypothetical protein
LGRATGLAARPKPEQSLRVTDAEPTRRFSPALAALAWRGRFHHEHGQPENPEAFPVCRAILELFTDTLPVVIASRLYQRIGVRVKERGLAVPCSIANTNRPRRLYHGGALAKANAGEARAQFNMPTAF